VHRLFENTFITLKNDQNQIIDDLHKDNDNRHRFLNFSSANSHTIDRAMIKLAISIDVFDRDNFEPKSGAQRAEL